MAIEMSTSLIQISPEFQPRDHSDLCATWAPVIQAWGLQLWSKAKAHL